MKPYAHLDIPHELITHRLQQYVKSSGLIRSGAFLNRVDQKTAYQAIPELQSLFEQYGLADPFVMLLCRCKPSTANPVLPHRDVLPYDVQTVEPRRAVAVNWPIFNYNDTHTAFYTAKTNNNVEEKDDLLGNGIPYKRYRMDQVVETHRIKIDRPTALRYDVIHAVINNTDSDRWTASFRFKTNHWNLFKKENT